MNALKNEIEYKLGFKLAEAESKGLDLGRPCAPPRERETYWTLMEVYDDVRFALLRKLDKGEMSDTECYEILTFVGGLCRDLTICNEISHWNY